MSVQKAELWYSSAEKAAEFLVLGELLSPLEALDTRRVKVVELRFFGGALRRRRKCLKFT